jgi:hypothetical protein
MDQNPYRSPDHYASRPRATRSEIPPTVCVAVSVTLFGGLALAVLGVSIQSPRTILLGLFLAAFGVTGACFIVRSWNKSR